MAYSVVLIKAKPKLWLLVCGGDTFVYCDVDGYDGRQVSSPVFFFFRVNISFITFPVFSARAPLQILVIEGRIDAKVYGAYRMDYLPHG